MNTSISMRTWGAVLGLALLGAGAAGCGEAAVGTDLETPDSPLLFADPTQSGPRLDIYDFGRGRAGISVSGPIGTEEKYAGLSDFDSLEQLYRTLHPDATVPPELTTLSRHLAPALAALKTMPRPETPREVTFEKSQASFNSTVCKSFKSGSAKYTPLECPWGGSVTKIEIKHAPASILPGDRTYGWNAINASGTMTWYTLDPAIAGKVTMNPNTWKWMSISGPEGERFWAAIGNTTRGELGLTHHDLSWIIQ
jgi:hypothetical protein